MSVAFRPGQDRIDLPLDQRHVVCPRHLAPFRAKWPEGWPVFADVVMRAAVNSISFQGGTPGFRWWEFPDVAWEDLDHRIGPAQARQLLEARPACEWVPELTLLEAYNVAGIGVAGLCRVCRILRRGAPYPVRSGQRYETVPHVCFICVVRGRI